MAKSMCVCVHIYLCKHACMLYVRMSICLCVYNFIGICIVCECAGVYVFVYVCVLCGFVCRHMYMRMRRMHAWMCAQNNNYRTSVGCPRLVDFSSRRPCLNREKPASSNQTTIPKLTTTVTATSNTACNYNFYKVHDHY